MATWIGHLRVADNLLDQIPGLDPRNFAYGSLAPDCGKKVEDGNGFIPPKSVSHLVVYKDKHPLFGDLLFYKKYLSNISRESDLKKYSFLLAYFVHLALDGLWFELIAEASRRDYQQLIEEKGDEAWWIMKDDWYGLDVQFVTSNPNSLFWREIMPLERYPIYLTFQKEDAVREQIKLIKDFNSDPPSDLLERDYFPYLNNVTMDRFVYDATALVLNILKEIDNNPMALSLDCSINLLPKELLHPYEAPLGDEGAS
jgi:hypothetical protein